MYTLEDISLYPFLLYLEKLSPDNSNYQQLYNFLIANQIFDFKRLEEFIRLGYPIVNTKEMYKMLGQAYKTLCKLNTGQLESQRYSFNNWLTNAHFQKVIQATDNEVLLNDILFRNPMNIKYGKTNIDWCSVSLAKHLLGKITIKGNNALAEVLRYIGPSKIDSLASNISLYDYHIHQVIKETPADFEGNLFFKDKETKSEIILAEIDAIVHYLVANGSEFLWGKLSDKAKASFIKSTIAPGIQDYRIRDNLINLIANYTTLSEVEQGLVRNRTLDRFITR